MRIFVLPALVSLTIGCRAGEVTSLAGKILFKGEVPKPKIINIAADKKAAAYYEGKPAPVYPDLIVSKAGGLANAVVFISKGLEGKKFETPKEQLVIKIAGAMYEPHVICAMVDQKIEIKEDGVTIHNPHPLSIEQPQFGRQQPRVGELPMQQFPNPELGIVLSCDVHPWMKARICVFEHPFFAVAALDGSFEIKGLNPGKYTLNAWHETLGLKSMEIEVKKSDNAPIEIVFEAK